MSEGLLDEIPPGEGFDPDLYNSLETGQPPGLAESDDLDDLDVDGQDYGGDFLDGIVEELHEPDQDFSTPPRGTSAIPPSEAKPKVRAGHLLFLRECIA